MNDIQPATTESNRSPDYGPNSRRVGPDFNLSQITLLAVLIIIVAAGVLTAHWPALSAKAISFDDNMYLLNNRLVQDPSRTSTKRFLIEILKPSSVQGYYQPLNMIFLMLDCARGGGEENLKPFRQTSLCLHVLNTALIIILICQLFGEPWVAAIVGLIFGVHPMTVETIPWVGERKTLLAAFFSLWCLIFYVRYARQSGWISYSICLLMYLLALMSKPTSTTLPVLFLLLDYWPLRRLGGRAVLEKVPIFILCGLSAQFIVTLSIPGPDVLCGSNAPRGSDRYMYTDYFVDHFTLPDAGYRGGLDDLFRGHFSHHGSRWIHHGHRCGQVCVFTCDWNIIDSCLALEWSLEHVQAVGRCRRPSTICNCPRRADPGCLRNDGYT